MADSTSHSALRQLRTHFSKRFVLIALVGISVVLAIAGPFGTDDLLRFVPRLAYWLPVAFVTYGIGFLTASWADLTFGRSRPVPRIAVKGAVTGIGVLGFVLLTNLLVFGFWPEPVALATTATTTLAIALVITIVLDLLDHSGAPKQTGLPALLERIPFDKRGPLIALSVEDHYVRVITTKGETMILMRLADAIRETAPVPGLQTHRSYWAALDQVTSARREGDRAVLTMSNATDIPVSRANVPAAKSAGLLP